MTATMSRKLRCLSRARARLAGCANVERDPGRDAYAAPELWTNYADFYARAAQASKVAYNASRAQQESAFKTFAIELRAACDACHAAYLKTDQ
jgi:cytochrome c556